MRFRLSLGRLMRVYGHSMAPMLNPGELVFVRQGTYRSRSPQRGEIVAACPASLGGKTFVKRVVGLPHERVRIAKKEWTLGEGEFFLLSDRSENSMDSRIFGPVTREELVGSIRLRVWPWKALADEHTKRGSAWKIRDTIRISCAPEDSGKYV